MDDTVELRRRNRMTIVAGPGGTQLSPSIQSHIQSLLTFIERKYDYTLASEGGSKFTFIERKLYCEEPYKHRLAFPIGLKPRVVKSLRQSGFNVKDNTTRIAPPAHRADAYYLDWDGLLSEFNVLDGQDKCISNVVATDYGVISSTTGWGKSHVARMLCRLFCKAKIHFVTKSATLADEIYTDLSKSIPNVGFFGRGKKIQGRVTVFIADSLHHGLGDADIVLADEVHELAAPKYSELLARYTNSRMYAFSATPTGRMDGRDIIVESLFGPIIYTVSYQESQASGRVVPITVEWLRVNQGPNVHDYKLPALKERYGIWRNQYRNNLIAQRLKHFKDDDQIMIMVKTIDHAVHLRKLLPDFTLCYAANGMDQTRINKYIRSGLLPEDEPLMTPSRLKQLREDFSANKLKKVIANYVWSTGVNFKQLNVLVRADAAASEIRDGQIPGRVCRRVEGLKESAIMIDCWDEWSTTFLGRSRSRKNNYSKRGWSQIWSDLPLVGDTNGCT